MLQKVSVISGRGRTDRSIGDKIVYLHSRSGGQGGMMRGLATLDLAETTGDVGPPGAGKGSRCRPVWSL